MSWHIFDLPETAYEDALDAQFRLHEYVRSNAIDGAILMLTHPPTVTLGRHANPQHILDADVLAHRGWSVFEVDRGGDVTWHGPGQIVLYPIIPLHTLGLSVRSLICHLSNALRATLAEFNIESQWEDDSPGVWVGRNKIAAVGLRISRRVSRHGIALNVAPDLSAYNTIVPCGLQDRGVTSMKQVLGTTPELHNVRATLLEHILRAFGCQATHTWMELDRGLQAIEVTVSADN